MADWIPRKVLADAALLERVPAVLDAWIRFAGRRQARPTGRSRRPATPFRAGMTRWSGAAAMQMRAGPLHGF